MQTRTLLFLGIIIQLLTISKLNAQEFYTKKGESFPSFEMADINNRTINNASLKGKPSLLIFFGTRCGPCMKELKELHLQIPRGWYNQINIYAIGSTDGRERLIRFKSKFNYNFKFIPDPQQDLFNRIGDHTIPRTFLLNANGEIIYQALGYNKTPFKNLLATIRSMVK